MDTINYVVFDDGDIIIEEEVDLDLYQDTNYSIYKIPSDLEGDDIYGYIKKEYC